MVDRDPIHGVQRRVTGYHDIRMDGMSDLLMRARGASVLDVGCNRGMVAYEFAHNGARLVHGVDNWELGISLAARTSEEGQHIAAQSFSTVDEARHIFSDMRNVQFRFECADLSRGAEALAVFGDQRYDFILLLAIVHKLSRVMSKDALREFLQHLGNRCNNYIAWRGGDDTMSELDEIFAPCGLRRVHTTYLSHLGPGAVWAR